MDEEPTKEEPPEPEISEDRADTTAREPTPEPEVIKPAEQLFIAFEDPKSEVGIRTTRTPLE